MTNDSPTTGVENISLGKLAFAEFPAIDDWESFRVHLAPEVYEQMLKHAAENDRIELCGVMVGEVYKDEKGPFLTITAAIRGEHSANQSAQVTFTQETWAHIHNVMDEKYSALKIVGWYHTHPGFGIFLSPMDMFIHENFFNMPWQVALVVDPRSGDDGFFCWKSGKVARMRHYWVGTEERVFLKTGTATAGAGDQAVRIKALESDVAELKQVGLLLSHKTRVLTRVVTSSCIIFAVLLAWLMAPEKWRTATTQRLADVVGIDTTPPAPKQLPPGGAAPTPSPEAGKQAKATAQPFFGLASPTPVPTQPPANKPQPVKPTPLQGQPNGR